jgi:FkbM family methyltransferase
MFSQNDEEAHILRACPEPSGRFLDIGAWHATDKSNTRALYERGWVGTLVEPSPGPASGLRAAYATGSGIVVIEAAVTLDGNPVEMWLTDDACSTSDPETHQKWAGIVAFQPEKVQIPGISLETLLAHGGFDFVSIDTEGTSGALMLRLLALGQRPRCICVEHDYKASVLRRAAEDYREVYSSGENLVLVRKW